MVDKTNIDADLTNFPVYIALPGLGASFFTQSKSDGSDILITSSDGTTKLDREIQGYSQGSNLGVLFFRAPSVTTATSTDFYIYWGNPAGAETNTTSVWRSEFSTVQHLDDLTTSTTFDSTSNTMNGTKSSANNPLVTTSGQLGSGQTFSSDLIDLNHNTPFDLGTGEFAIFIWAKATAVSGNYFMAGRFENSGNFDGWAMGTNMTTNFAFARWRKAGVNYDATDSLDTNDNTFHRYVHVRRSTGIYIYRDGVSRGSNLNANTQLTTDNGQHTVIGSERSGSTASTWLGSEDEFYLWKGTAPVDAWIKADYINQATPTTFYILGGVESLNGGGAFLLHFL